MQETSLCCRQGRDMQGQGHGREEAVQSFLGALRLQDGRVAFIDFGIVGRIPHQPHKSSSQPEERGRNKT